MANKSKKELWKVPIQLGDEVMTNDGFKGKIVSGEKGKWRIKYRPGYYKGTYYKARYGFYSFDELILLRLVGTDRVIEVWTIVDKDGEILFDRKDTPLIFGWESSAKIACKLIEDCKEVVPCEIKLIK